MINPLTATAVALMAAGSAHAQFLVNELSFGYAGRIIPEGSTSIPNFALQGTPQQPDILSNKIIFTPPAPGNQRSSLWAERPLAHKQWIADVDFRASGPERAGGNFNLWLVRNGPQAVGLSSIYTAGKFDGLALVVDTHGGTGGMVRGFLNDGATDYSTRRDIDELAFGHCAYAYRNLGRPSQIKLRQSATMFRVEVDSTLCFETDKFSLPTGYNFGITAATPDSPDSFEIFKMVVMSDNIQADHPPSSNNNNNNQQKQQQSNQQQQQQQQQQRLPDDPFDNAIPDQQADQYTNSMAQFTDLHNRIQSVNHHVSSVYRVVTKQQSVDEQRHAEVSRLLSELRGELTRSTDAARDLGARLTAVEKELRGLRADLTSRVRESEHSLKGFLVDHHSTLADKVLATAPLGHGRLIFVIVASQVVLVSVYVLYKRRKNSGPKKFL